MLAQTSALGLAQSFAVALLIGALLGIEREKKKETSPHPSFAGVRTFMLLAEAGAVSAWLSRQMAMPLIFGVALGGTVGLIAVAYVLEKRADGRAVGLTTSLAGITVFLLGAAVMFGHAAVAVGLAVVNTSILAFKDPLHGLVQKLGKDDIFAGLKLLIASFIVLPLLPDLPVDPWGVLNPYKLWLLVVMISGLSLVGYVAIRTLGSARGVAVTGVTGGLVSSTAVTLSMSRESAAAGSTTEADAYAAGILMAWVVMFLRVGGMVLLLNPALLTPMAPAYLAMLVTNLLFAGIYYVRSLRGLNTGAVAAVNLHNPFSLWSATKFGLLFAGVLLMVELARRILPVAGLIYVAVLAGTTDVDAMTLAMAEQGGKSIAQELAAQAVLVCVLSNTAAKAALAAALGSRGLGHRILLATAVMFVLGVVMIMAA